MEQMVLTKEREFKEDCYIHLLLFGAGIALLMACFKRALMVFLLEEWRLWVFLFLNLVLLSILFTSTLSAQKEESKKDDNGDQKKTMKRPSSGKCWSEEERGVENEVEKCEDIIGKKGIGGKILSSESCGGVDVNISCIEGEQKEGPRLSKEELNERAEAFIVMFRQHLVLDARKCGRRGFFERSERVECVN